MAVKKILLGQVWKKDDTGENFLVTKLYNEVFSTFAVLRREGSQDATRVKVGKTTDGQNLPGYTYTQESAEF